MYTPYVEEIFELEEESRNKDILIDTLYRQVDSLINENRKLQENNVILEQDNAELRDMVWQLSEELDCVKMNNT